MSTEDTDSLPRMQVVDERVVLRHGDPYDQYGARDVWVFVTDHGYVMHYDAAGPSGWLAAAADSDDGLHWTKRGTLLALGAPGEDDSASASYGTVCRDEERWHMFYLGTPRATPPPLRVPAFPYLTMKAEATSALGPWKKRPDVVPFRNDPGTWYDHTASPGHVISWQGEYLMYFSGSTIVDGRTWRTLGLARSRDLSGQWRLDPEPLLPGTEQIENSSLHFEPESDLWFLFTNHVAAMYDIGVLDDSGAPQLIEEYTDAIWVYWSSDPTSFSPANKAVVLDGNSSTWSPRVIGLPSVLPLGDRLALYYDGSPEDTISHGHRDVAVAFLELPLRPPTS